jgi:hypothetical protein
MFCMRRKSRMTGVWIICLALVAFLGFALLRLAPAATEKAALPSPEDRYIMGLTSHHYDTEFFKLVPKSEWGYMRHPKIELRWDRVEPQKGVYKWEDVDVQLEALRKNGFDDLSLLVNVPTPAWAQDSSYGKTARRAPSKNPDDWRRLIQQVVLRYGSAVDYYEILNEPGWDMNSAAMDKYGSFHFGGNVETDYLEMLKVAYAEIKQQDPTSQVISGAMNCDVSGVPENGLWLMDLLTDDEHRMQDYCDAFSLHPYYDPSQWGYAYRLLRELLDGKGISQEIYITEIGWPHGSDKEVRQDGLEDQRSAIGLEGLGDLISSGCRKIWVYQDLDDPPGTDYEGLYYGLFDYKGKPTPAWSEFRGWCRVFDMLNRLQPSLDM